MQTRKGVDDSLRQVIIQEHLSGASKYSLSKKYNLGTGNVISYWMRIFGVNDAPREEEMSKSQESERIAALEKELKVVKASLSYEKMRADAYDKMIEIAEEKFNLPIRKKAGTKRQRR